MPRNTYCVVVGIKDHHWRRTLLNVPERSVGYSWYHFLSLYLFFSCCAECMYSSLSIFNFSVLSSSSPSFSPLSSASWKKYALFLKLSTKSATPAQQLNYKQISAPIFIRKVFWSSSIWEWNQWRNWGGERIRPVGGEELLLLHYAK